MPPPDKDIQCTASFGLVIGNSGIALSGIVTFDAVDSALWIRGIGITKSSSDSPNMPTSKDKTMYMRIETPHDWLRDMLLDAAYLENYLNLSGQSTASTGLYMYSAAAAGELLGEHLINIYAYGPSNSKIVRNNTYEINNRQIASL